MNAQLPVRTMDDFRDVVYTFRLSRVIATAMDLDLFTHMGRRLWTPKSLARTLKASERGIEILLRNLKTAGLLTQRGTSYRAEKLGRTFLNRNSPDYQGAYLELVHRQWEDWARLTDSVRTGKPVEAPGGPAAFLAENQGFVVVMGIRHVTEIIDATLIIDPARWRKYGLQPLDIADGPASPFYDRYRDHVERHLDYLVDTQGSDGAWAPHWSWAGTFPEAWERASVAWKGRLTVGRLRQLAAFGRVEER